HHQADRLAGTVDALHHEALARLQLADQFARCLIVGHAAIVEADDVRPGHRLTVIDDYARAGSERHSERQRDPQHLLRLAFRLDQHGSDYRHAGLDPPVLAGEADL